MRREKEIERERKKGGKEREMKKKINIEKKTNNMQNQIKEIKS